ncbi:MAG: hypothetical protein IKX21_05740 [Deltaproteobacteria bacterium]|nr:hypothetical protein [Deltaproteobacteria bacterium]
MKVRTVVFTGALLVLAVVLAGCFGAAGNSREDKQASIRSLADSTLENLYKLHPETRNKIKSSAGYAVFSNINAHVLLVGGGYGYGLCVRQSDNTTHYMKMVQLGVGPGLAAKDFRLVFIFKDPTILQQFLDGRWDVNSKTDFAAKLEPQTPSTTSGTYQISSMDEVETYSITEAGVAVQVTLSGGRYWKDPELN